MAIEKLVYGKNVRDSVQANYVKTNEIIDKMNEGGSDTGLHAYTIYEGNDFGGTSFNTTAPITNFKFIELYYTYQASTYSSIGISNRQFVKICNPTTDTTYKQDNFFKLEVYSTSDGNYVFPCMIEYEITFTDATTLNFIFKYSYTPRYTPTSINRISRYNSDTSFNINLGYVIGYV